MKSITEKNWNSAATSRKDRDIVALKAFKQNIPKKQRLWNSCLFTASQLCLDPTSLILRCSRCSEEVDSSLSNVVTGAHARTQLFRRVSKRAGDYCLGLEFMASQSCSLCRQLQEMTSIRPYALTDGQSKEYAKWSHIKQRKKMQKIESAMTWLSSSVCCSHMHNTLSSKINRAWSYDLWVGL